MATKKPAPSASRAVANWDEELAKQAAAAAQTEASTATGNFFIPGVGRNAGAMTTLTDNLALELDPERPKGALHKQRGRQPSTARIGTLLEQLLSESAGAKTKSKHPNAVALQSWADGAKSAAISLAKSELDMARTFDMLEGDELQVKRAAIKSALDAKLKAVDAEFASETKALEEDKAAREAADAEREAAAKARKKSKRAKLREQGFDPGASEDDD